MRTARVVVLLLVAASLAAADSPKSPWDPLRATSPDTVAELRVLETLVQEVNARSQPTVVAILAGPGAGSGVIVREDGLVLTSALVLGQPGIGVRFVLPDGTTVGGRTLGVNAKTDTGMARITDPPPKSAKWPGAAEGKWPAAPLGKAADLKNGQWVIALGHAGGPKPDRPPPIRVGRVEALSTTDKSLRTTCLVIGGDNGGPLFDLTGKVVGIHSRIGIFLEYNLHVPTEAYVAQWDQLHRGEVIGKTDYPDLGKALAVDPAQQPTDRGNKQLPKLFKSAAAAATRATVRVQCDGQDAALGLVVSSDGYILTKGSEIHGAVTCVFADGATHPSRVVGYHKATDLGLLKIAASGLARVSFAPASAVVVGRWVATTTVAEEPLAVGVVGAPIRKLHGEQAVVENLNKGYLGVSGLRDAEDTDGVVVAEVMPAGAAAGAGMQADDVIFAVNGKVVKDRDALLAAMENYRAGQQVAFRVRRGDDKVGLTVKLGAKGGADPATLQYNVGGPLSGRRTGFPAVFSHDTVVHPKNCGGLLVDLEGKVIGLNIARAGRSETWALPGSAIEPVLEDLLAGKHGEK